MAIGRLKGVARGVFDAAANQNFLADRLRTRELEEDASEADALDFLEFPTYTVSDGVDTNGDLQDVTINQIGLTGENIELAEHPAIFVEIGVKDEIQLSLDENAASLFSKKLVSDLRNEIDTRLLRAARTAAYAAGAGTYHGNVEGGAVTKKMIFDEVGRLENAGSARSSVEIWVNPMTLGAFAELEQWFRASGEQTAAIGATNVGAIGDIPVISSKIVPYRRSIAFSASAISSNALTLTVAAGHSVVPATFVSTTGASANVATPGAAVASVTATTIVLPLTSGDNATNGAGTAYVESAENLIVARDVNKVAMQLVPSLKLVDGGRARVSNLLKCYALFGQRWRVGNVRIFHTAP